MLLFPHAKINLGLNVVQRRPDGFHELQSIMLPIPLRDALEVVVDPVLEAGQLHYTRSGLIISGENATDLCMRAVAAVQELRAIPGLRIHLHKKIPMGAGLGGGSSDGAHMLLLLNNLLSLDLQPGELHEIASKLGSDCPFFLRNTPQIAQGRGELLQRIELDLSGLWLVLVNPGVHIPTPEAFRNCSPTGNSIDAEAIVRSHALDEWDRLMPNTLEQYAMTTYPTVAAAKRSLLEAGSAYAAMSGSGSTVFGFFREEPPEMEWPEDHSQWIFRL